MDCQQCREAVSAALDGEAAPDERAAADAHAAQCPACAEWAGSAGHVTRLARVRPAEQAPDLAAAVLAALGIPDPAAAGSSTDVRDMRAAGDTGSAEPARRPELTCLAGGCCGDAAPAQPRSACGCVASCGCGCQDGAPCRCGTRAA